MNLIVLSDDVLIEELTCSGVDENTNIERIRNINDFRKFPDADAWIDLLFKPDDERITLLKELNTKPVIINSVEKSLSGTSSNFVRINGWPTFLKRKVVEASTLNETLKPLTERIFSSLNRRVQWVPDEAGFISARVVAMIINEAFFVLGENVSTREDIDIAMKLGTNYPLGPFEWSEKIGLNKIHILLEELSKSNKIYEPSAFLRKAASEIK
jgi:3-hydroxybutyryl-CoA dehydrogenase